LEKIKPNAKNLALVLEGGGAKGAYHVGALRALYEAGYRFSTVTGTSIGALNAAILSQDGLERLRKFWHDVRISDIMEFDDEIAEKLGNKELDLKTLTYLAQSVMRIRKVINASSSKMEKFVKLSIDEEKIRNSNLRMGFVTYCVSKLEAVEKFADEVEEGKLADYLIASATFPLYGFYEIDGEKYIDGGVWDNLPVNLAARGGAKDIIAIRTSDKVRRRKIIYDDLNIHYIIPSESFMGQTMAFLPDRIERYEKVGYLDALRYIKGYKGNKYYIELKGEAQLDKLLKEKCEKVAKQLSFELSSPFRRDAHTVESLISFIKERLPFDDMESLSDTDTVLALFEYFALHLDMERLKIYSAREFLLSTADKLFEVYPDEAMLLRKTRDFRRHAIAKIFYALARELKESYE